MYAYVLLLSLLFIFETVTYRVRLPSTDIGLIIIPYPLLDNKRYTVVVDTGSISVPVYIVVSVALGITVIFSPTLTCVVAAIVTLNISLTTTAAITVP